MVRIQKERLAFEQPWAGAALQEWKNASQSVVITDLSQCKPASALFWMRLKKGTWKVIPYEMTDGIKGNMIWTAEEAEAPELALPLKVTGWYAIFIGLYSSYDFPVHKVWLRLNKNSIPVSRINDWNRASSQDPSFAKYFSYPKSEYNCSHGNSEEIFYTVAKLSEDINLYIAQQRTVPRPCGVTHITLVPLTGEEIRFVLADRTDKSHRTLAVTNDMGWFAYLGKYPMVREPFCTIEALRNTDFGTVLLHSAGSGDTVRYPSKIGHMLGTAMDLFVNPYERSFVESARELARKGLNPVKLFINEAHKIGVKVHVGNRPAGWSFYEPYCDSCESPFFKNNPQWRCMDRDGTLLTRMSWAVPEVRKHLIALFQEQIRFGADGAHIVFNRGIPVVFYEPAAVKIFLKKHDEDPRTIDETDPRITWWWSDIIETFMRELRDMLEREQARRKDKKRLEISVMVLGDEKANLHFGIDIRRLVKEGLVDEIYPWGWTFPHEFEWPNRKHGFDLDFFREVCGKKGAPFIPTTTYKLENDNKSWHSLSGIRRFIENGAKGIAIWDPEMFESDIYYWSIFSRMGHKEETLWREKNLDISHPPRIYHEFHRLGEHVRDGRIGVQWGG